MGSPGENILLYSHFLAKTLQLADSLIIWILCNKLLSSLVGLDIAQYVVTSTSQEVTARVQF